VAVSGDTVVVGSFKDDDNGFTDAGAVYVYVPDGSGGWTETKLFASDGSSNSWLGYSVAISGDTIVAGAPPKSGSFSTQGATYVFEADGSGGGIETTKLTASDETAAHNLAGSLAVSGGTVVAGAHGGGTGGGNSGAAYVFDLVPPNAPPVADAGPDRSIPPVVTVDLDGTGSMDDQTATTALIHAWTLTAPAGSSAALSDASSATPSFVADLPGTYTAQLVVTDEGALSSAADSVLISSANLAPTADAGTGQVVQLGAMAVLDGSASTDPDADALTYAWTLDSAPAGSTAALVSAATAGPTLTPDVEGSYIISLVVNDGFVNSDADTVEVVAIGAVFAQSKLGEACDFVSGLPNASFDAKGHRKSMCNDYARIIKFIQKGQLGLARSHLNAAIERVDGCRLRGQADPKGGSQPYAADYLVVCVEQETVYDFLTAALAAIE